MRQLLNNTLFACLCIILLQACQKSPKDFVDGGDYKYWYHTVTVELKTIGTTCCQTWYYYFGNDGKYIIFEETDGKWQEYDGFDCIYAKEWQIEEDSIIISHYRHRIVELNDDRMILSWKNKRLDTLYAVPKESIPKEFQRKW